MIVSRNVKDKKNAQDKYEFGILFLPFLYFSYFNIFARSNLNIRRTSFHAVSRYWLFFTSSAIKTSGNIYFVTFHIDIDNRITPNFVSLR